MKYLGLVVIALIAISCVESDSFVTEGGTTVNYLEKGTGDTPADTMVSLFKLRYTTEDGKVIYESMEEPRPLKIDPKTQADQGELFACLSNLRIGDSVAFELEAKELFEKTFRAPLPDSIGGESKIQFQVAYVDQLTESGYYEMVEKMNAEKAKKQLVIDREILDQYFSENNIEGITTDSGLRYVITEEGQGEMPQNGNTVEVNYAGYLLDGTLFDTSIESVARAENAYEEGRPYNTFTFALGQGRVIKGWDEG
ncbi:MAG: FKBP-type peptidyl-prolyl cis-trans isomerase, partial [Bacteroidota bacterium]